MTNRVQLIVTGDMEKLALHKSGSDAQGSGLNLTGALRPVRFGDGYHYLVHHYQIFSFPKREDSG